MGTRLVNRQFERIARRMRSSMDINECALVWTRCGSICRQRGKLCSRSYIAHRENTERHYRRAMCGSPPGGPANQPYSFSTAGH